MSIFGFLFYLGIINIIFSFVWKWVIVLPTAVLFALIKLETYGMRLVRIFGAYLLASLTALLTLTALGDNPSGFALLFYPIVGAFVLLMGFANGQYEAQKEARQTNDWELMQMLQRDAGFNLFLMLGAVVFYVVALFLPALSATAPVAWLFVVIGWIYNLPIIGLLLGIGGVLFLLSTIFYGLIAIGGIGVFAFSKIRGKRPSASEEIRTEETAKLL